MYTYEPETTLTDLFSQGAMLSGVAISSILCQISILCRIGCLMDGCGWSPCPDPFSRPDNCGKQVGQSKLVVCIRERDGLLARSYV